jgi:hypothetical protein
MKVVKLLRCDYTTQERPILQILPRAQTHANDICFPVHRPRMSTPHHNVVVHAIKTRPDSRKLINNVLGDTLSVVLTGDRVGQDNLIDEFAHSPLEAPVTLVIVRTGETRREP